MKFFRLLFIAILFLQFISLAQEGWVQQMSGTNNYIKSIHFVDNNTGWAGAGGDLLKTTNAGEIWETIYNTGLAGSKWFESIHFIDDNIGWATLFSYEEIMYTEIIKTTNGGFNWFGHTVFPTYYGNFYKVFFSDANNGWVIGTEYPFGTGGIVYNTTNGGVDWIMKLNDSTRNFFSTHFLDENVGWIAGDGVFKTTDGGENWTEQLVSEVYDIQFVDSNNGWAVGTFRLGCSAHRTTNGGDDWIDMTTFLDEIYSVFFTDPMNGWVVGYREILQPAHFFISGTDDGGITWTEQYSSTKSIWSVFFLDDTTGWAVGDSGLVLHTTNGGVSFVEENEIDVIPTDYYLSYNYPNPFNPTTRIKYQLPKLSFVTIKVFDVLGNEIETLVNEEKPTGTYEITWYAEGLPSGVYFYQLKTGDFVQTMKMVLVK